MTPQRSGRKRESDEENASLRNALAACEESDQEDAENMTPPTLLELRSVEQALKNFVTSVQENRDTPISFSY